MKVMNLRVVILGAVGLLAVVGAVGCELPAEEQGAPCESDEDCNVDNGESCTDPDGDGTTNCNCACNTSDQCDPLSATERNVECTCDIDCNPGGGGSGSECTRASDCASDEICSAGRCVPGGGGDECTTSADCGADEECMGGTCMPMGGGCTGDADCAFDEECLGGVCVPVSTGCTADTDCAFDEECVGGTCVPVATGCTNDNQCGLDEYCDLGSGMCMPNAAGCTSDNDCGAFFCDTMSGQCVQCLQAIDCPQGQTCSAAGTCTGGGGGSCADMCAHIYQDCGFGFQDNNGTPVDEAGCATACEGGGFGGAEVCLETVACDEASVNACFGGGGGTGECSVDPQSQACGDCQNAGFGACIEPGGVCEADYGTWADCLMNTPGCVDAATGQPVESCMTAGGACESQTNTLFAQDGCLSVCEPFMACY